ncbi:MAG: hypothetical protein AAFX05_08920 [Planctomycetota bacterium]
MHRFSLVILMICLSTPPVAAQGPDDLHQVEQVPVDTELVLSRMQEHYGTRPVHESVNVTLALDGVSRTETFSLRIQPVAGAVPRFELQMGEITLWSTDDTLHAVHAYDARRAFRHDSNQPLIAVRSILPPLACPQLELARGELVSLPFVPEITWSEATLRGEMTPRFVLKGQSAAGDARLVVDAESGAIRRMVAALPDDRGSIQLTITEQPPLDAPLGADLTQRRPVGTIAELGPDAGDIQPGDHMPNLSLALVHPDPEPLAAKASNVYILSRAWWEQGDAVLDAVRTAVGPRSDVEIIPVAVAELGPGFSALRAQLEGIAARVKPQRLRYAINARITIDRLDPDAPAVIVVTLDGTVRTITPVTAQTALRDVTDAVRRGLSPRQDREGTPADVPADP